MATLADISLDLVDDPEIQMRSELDTAELDELMTSMREVGLIEPVVLNKKGDRFEVIAGHRRVRAARLLQWPVISAKVEEMGDEQALALRIAENLTRTDVDPVDEATFVGEVMLRYKKSEREVAELLKRSVQWVKDRLEIFQMPPSIQQHLKYKKYPLGAAYWLMQIPTENEREYYANWAAIYSVSVAGAKQWALLARARRTPFVAGEVEIRDERGVVQVVRKVVSCGICRKDVFLDEADSIWIHPPCATPSKSLD